MQTRSTARSKPRRAEATVLKAAEFKASALSVMRSVHETGQAVTVTSRGKALVRIEPVRRKPARTGYGSMKGTIELAVPDDAIVSKGSSAAWETIEEWDEMMRS